MSHLDHATRAVTVALDPTFRVVRVEVASADLVRSVESLNTELSTAYAAALSARLPPPEGSLGAEDQDVRPMRIALKVRRPTPEMLARHRVRNLANARPRRRVPREVSGSSANGCVTITLPPVGRRGHLDADAGWLRQATRAQIGIAVTEAFRDAYSRRDT